MEFFISDPTPFDWFMMFLVYLVAVPASIYMTVVLYRMRRERIKKELEHKKFVEENPHLYILTDEKANQTKHCSITEKEPCKIELNLMISMRF